MKTNFVYAAIFFAGACSSALVMYAVTKSSPATLSITAQVANSDSAPISTVNISNDQIKNSFDMRDAKSNALVQKPEAMVKQIENIKSLEAIETHSEYDVLPIAEPRDNNAELYFSYEVGDETPSEHQHLLDNALNDEALDSVWADQKQQYSYQFIENSNIKSVNLVETRCKSTLCKVVVNVADKRAQQALFEYAATDPNFVINDKTGVVFQQPDGNGGNNITYYLARSGYQLPSL